MLLFADVITAEVVLHVFAVLLSIRESLSEVLLKELAVQCPRVEVATHWPVEPLSSALQPLPAKRGIVKLKEATPLPVYHTTTPAM